jgi:4-hydroxy-tetrahydrodipicolinate reductase
MLKIALSGATGKMGSEIITLLSQSKDKYQLEYAIVSNPEQAQNKLNDLAKVITNDIATLNKNIDVVIDFSTPTFTLKILQQCVAKKIPLVIGTTGFNLKEEGKIAISSKQIPILLSANMSFSINLMYKLISIAAKSLKSFEVEIIDSHHRNKKDSPSGTALELGKIVAKSREIDFYSHAILDNNLRNVPRKAEDICFSSVRAGNIIGSHFVEFIGESEILSIRSEITNRNSFAKGALLAANFLRNQPPNLYSMQDVLEI